MNTSMQCIECNSTSSIVPRLVTCQDATGPNFCHVFVAFSCESLRLRSHPLSTDLRNQNNATRRLFSSRRFLDLSQHPPRNALRRIEPSPSPSLPLFSLRPGSLQSRSTSVQLQSSAQQRQVHFIPVPTANQSRAESQTLLSLQGVNVLRAPLDYHDYPVGLSPLGAHYHHHGFSAIRAYYAGQHSPTAS